MERLLCVVIGYLFGLIQTGYIYGKIKNIDIRKHGSGNAGTTNALRTLGWKAGVITFIGDCLKCVLAVAIIRLIFIQDLHVELYAMYTGLGAVLGHNFPFYLNFKGGKGIAATAGLIISLHPLLIPMGLIAFFGTFILTHYVSLGSLLVYAGLMVEIVILGQNGFFEGLTQVQLYEMYAITFFLAVIAYWKHKDNIVRLLKGNERKTYLFKKNEV